MNVRKFCLFAVISFALLPTARAQSVPALTRLTACADFAAFPNIRAIDKLDNLVMTRKQTLETSVQGFSSGRIKPDHDGCSLVGNQLDGSDGYTRNVTTLLGLVNDNQVPVALTYFGGADCQKQLGSDLKGAHDSIAPLRTNLKAACAGK